MNLRSSFARNLFVCKEEKWREGRKVEGGEEMRESKETTNGGQKSNRKRDLKKNRKRTKNGKKIR